MATQAERRAGTRRTLLDAAARVLVEEGTGGFTTTTVTARAGVSNGALFRHFPTRLDLVAATVEHVLVRLRDDYERTFAGLTDGTATGDTVPTADTVLDLLWAAMSDPELAAVFELYTQARTDDALLAAIHPIVTSHGEYVRGLVERVASAMAPDDPDAARRVAGLGNLAILAMQGLVVGQMAGASVGAECDLLPAVSHLVRGAIRS